MCTFHDALGVIVTAAQISILVDCDSAEAKIVSRASGFVGSRILGEVPQSQDRRPPIALGLSLEPLRIFVTRASGLGHLPPSAARLGPSALPPDTRHPVEPPSRSMSGRMDGAWGAKDGSASLTRDNAKSSFLCIDAIATLIPSHIRACHKRADPA